MMTETVSIEGTVEDYTKPVSPYGKPNYALSFVTVKCPVTGIVGNIQYAYYYFRITSAGEARKLFKGAEIKCLLERESRIWTDGNGNWKMKDQMWTMDGTRQSMGRVPITLDSYKLVGGLECKAPNTEKDIYMDGSLDGENAGDDDLPF